MIFNTARKLLAISCVFLTLLSCTHKGNKITTPKPTLVQVPGKKPLILRTDRPLNLETPAKYFLEDFTPNDAFFVRWHLSNLPPKVGEDTFRLRIGGNVNKELALSMNDLKTKFTPYTVNALCVCAGNSRGNFTPQVPGVQWGNGAMGNAKWTGVKLKDIIAMAEAKGDTKYIAFNGMETPPMPATPDFVKSLDFEHATDGEVIVAYEMNGEPIPYLNGYPLKLVVPGWYATYWIGMLNQITLSADTFKGFWMTGAYLSPKDVPNGNEKPDSLAKKLAPVNKIDVRAVFVAPEPDSVLESGKEYEIQGLAFDGGAGITKVEISSDSGKTWMATNLDASLGNYSWRRWRYKFTPPNAGGYKFFVKATNAKGESQPWKQWNRSGYLKNGIESLTLNAE